jgi:hypothetical protein
MFTYNEPTYTTDVKKPVKEVSIYRRNKNGALILKTREQWQRIADRESRKFQPGFVGILFECNEYFRINFGKKC